MLTLIIKDYFLGLTDKELLAAFEGYEEWNSTDKLSEDNYISLLCDKYELETNTEFVDTSALADQVLYEMARRFYNLKR